jgi:hypothetical protein
MFGYDSIRKTFFSMTRAKLLCNIPLLPKSSAIFLLPLFIKSLISTRCFASLMKPVSLECLLERGKRAMISARHDITHILTNFTYIVI